MKMQRLSDFVRQNEAIFRNILRDIKANNRVLTREYIPSDLETDMSLDELILKYVERPTNEGFNITGFHLLPHPAKLATLRFENIPLLLDHADVYYNVQEDCSARYAGGEVVKMGKKD